MRAVIRNFELQKTGYIKYPKLVDDLRISRVMVDLLIHEAKEKGLLTQDSDGDVRRSIEGKHYAVEHKLIRR